MGVFRKQAVFRKKEYKWPVNICEDVQPYVKGT